MSDETLSLNRRYRPKRLSEYVGNDRIKKNALSALANKSKPQLLLFHGSAGCGKTTLARLMVKEYLCLDRDIEVGACDKCENCIRANSYIESGDYTNVMDVREVDATDANGRKDIDDLLEDAQYPSYTGGWKVYVIDECHMLTVTAQNRLLKNFEEPTERVLFILCTTNPENLIQPIISRCQYSFRVKKPTTQEMLPLLTRVCKNESIEYDIRGLSQLIVRSGFVPRDTLINLEKVMRAHSRADYSAVVDVLEIISMEYFVNFYKYLLSDHIDLFKYINFISKVVEAYDLKQYMTDLINFTKRGIYVVNNVQLSGLDESEVKIYRELFKDLSVSMIASIINTLLSIEESTDIETRLILLGYKGLVPKRASNTSVNEGSDIYDSLNEENLRSDSEGSFESKVHLESRTMTEEEKERFIESATSPVTHEELLSTFSGIEVEE